MEIQIMEMKNPKYSNAENTTVDVEVKFSHMPEEFVWFTASPNDTTSYGPEIYQRAINGDFGLVQAYQGN